MQRNSSRPVGLGLIVVVLLGLTWYLVDPWPAASTDSESAAADSTAADSSASAAKALEGSAETDASPGVPPRSVREQRAEIESEVVAPEDRLQIRVVDSANQPVAGVLVRYTDPNAKTYRSLPASRQRELDLVMHDVEAYLQATGKRSITDAMGIAKTELPLISQKRNGRHWRACARSPGRDGASFFASTWIDATDRKREPVVLTLRPDRSFRVRVEDPSGVSVPRVKISLAYDEPERGRHHRSLGITSEAGELLVAHVQELFAGYAHAPGDGIVAIDGPGARVDNAGVVGAASAHISLSRLPMIPVVLVMPAAGTVEIRVEDGHGHPAAGIRSISLRDSAGRQFSFPVREQPTAVCSHVLVGQRYTATAHVRLVGKEFSSVEFDGPQKSGETVRVLLRPTRTTTAFLGRALAEAQPLAGRKIAGTRATTDAEGRFRLEFSAAMTGRKLGSVPLRIRTEDRVFECALPWTAPMDGLEHDLGDLSFDPVPLLLAGRVEGTGALEKVGLRVQRHGDKGWSTDGDVDLIRDDDGQSFRFFGKPGSTPLRLLVMSHHHLPISPMPFVAGAEDLAVRLRQGGSLAMSCRLGDPVLQWMIMPRLIPTSGPALQAMRAHVDGLGDSGMFLSGEDRRFPTRQDGHLEKRDKLRVSYDWDSLWPGTYRVEVRAWGIARPLASVTGIVIEEGEKTIDERLDEIDTSATKHIELRFPDYRAKPGEWSGIVTPLLGHDPSREAYDITAWNDGGSRVWIPAPTPLDLRVEVPGYRTVELREVSESRTIALKPGIEVDVEVRGPSTTKPTRLVVQPETDAAARQFFSRSSGIVRSWKGARHTLLLPGGARKQKLSLSAPGVYRVSRPRGATLAIWRVEDRVGQTFVVTLDR